MESEEDINELVDNIKIIIDTTKLKERIKCFKDVKYLIENNM